MSNPMLDKLQHVPKGFEQFRQFVNWKPASRGRKLPCDRHGRVIDAHDPENWLSAEEAAASTFGIAFVFSRYDPLWFIDLDDARVGDGWSRLAHDTCAYFPGCAIEVSASGDGLHLFGAGAHALPLDHPCKNKSRTIELYTHGRFVALTGNGLRGNAWLDYSDRLAAFATYAGLEHAPEDDSEPVTAEERDPRYTGPENDDDLVCAMMGATGGLGTMFGDKCHPRALWHADKAELARHWPATGRDDGAPFDWSSADAALMSHLSFWTGRDRDRMARLFRTSPLYRPEKYEGKSAYLLERVIKLGARNASVYDRPRAAAVVSVEPVADIAVMFAGIPAVCPPGAEPCTAPTRPLSDLDKDAMPEVDNSFAESDIADVFVRIHHRHVRYVANWNKWMIYAGGVWTQEGTLLAYNLIGEIIKVLTMTRPGATPSDIKGAKKASVRNGVATIARTDRKIAARDAQWDLDDWLLNTPGGVVDLRTGQLFNNDPMHYMTKITNVAPEGYCPKWRQFLADITSGDVELQNYLQRLVGYCLTGCTREQALVFLYGSGRNGKGTFIDTISWIMNDYHTGAAIETFTENRNERHSTELARLRGARLVTSQEVEEGKYWAESRIKALTGQDAITARFMRADDFTYLPKFQLVIAANHRPKFRNIDAAMRGRIQLVPFTVSFQEDQQNKNLRDELKVEGAGILHWMIEGCLTWQREGLNPPAIVKTATKDYLDSEDNEGRWLEDHTVKDTAAVTPLAVLYHSWNNFASQSRLPQGNDKRLSERLQEQGFKKMKGRAGIVFEGIRIKDSIELGIKPNIIPFPTPGFEKG